MLALSIKAWMRMIRNKSLADNIVRLGKINNYLKGSILLHPFSCLQIGLSVEICFLCQRWLDGGVKSKIRESFFWRNEKIISNGHSSCCHCLPVHQCLPWTMMLPGTHTFQSFHNCIQSPAFTEVKHLPDWLNVRPGSACAVVMLKSILDGENVPGFTVPPFLRQ